MIQKKPLKFINETILIEVVEIPSICPEFDTGCPADFPFPEFWNCVVNAYYVDVEKNSIIEMKELALKVSYKFIHGRSERIEYWKFMKYLLFMEEK